MDYNISQHYFFTLSWSLPTDCWSKNKKYVATAHKTRDPKIILTDLFRMTKPSVTLAVTSKCITKTRNRMQINDRANRYQQGFHTLQYTSVHIYYTWIPNNVLKVFYFFCKIATTVTIASRVHYSWQYWHINPRAYYLHVLIISYP